MKNDESKSIIGKLCYEIKAIPLVLTFLWVITLELYFFIV